MTDYYLRRRSVLFMTTSMLGLAPINTPDTGIIAGAIRWDAWYRPTGSAGLAQQSLEPSQFQARAPAHCQITTGPHLTCVGTQAIIDAEIQKAHEAGLSFWAFAWYSPESSLREAWSLYQQSSIAHLIKWCGIVGLDQLGSVPFANGAWKGRIEEWAKYMQQPNYQKVSIGGSLRRPVLFLLWQADGLRSYFADSVENVHFALAYLHDLVVASGLNSPYIVILHGVAGAAIRERAGADAISSYISMFRSGDDGPWPYVDLDRQTQNYWTSLAATGQSVVPIAMVGWDVRPRIEHPFPPEKRPQNGRLDVNRYYVLPTPSELAAHLQAAVSYIRHNPQSCPSQLLLIYSWDECDEGGGLVPTLGDPQGRYLSAIRPVLRIK